MPAKASRHAERPRTSPSCRRHDRGADEYRAGAVQAFTRLPEVQRARVLHRSAGQRPVDRQPDRRRRHATAPSTPTSWSSRDAPAARWADVTAGEFLEEVRAVAKGLIAAGVEAGDRVALISRTRYEWTLLDYAIWFAGAATVPVYETSSAEQVAWILDGLRRPGRVRRDRRARLAGQGGRATTCRSCTTSGRSTATASAC